MYGLSIQTSLLHTNAHAKHYRLLSCIDALVTVHEAGIVIDFMNEVDNSMDLSIPFDFVF